MPAIDALNDVNERTRRFIAASGCLGRTDYLPDPSIDYWSFKQWPHPLDGWAMAYGYGPRAFAHAPEGAPEVDPIPSDVPARGQALAACGRRQGRREHRSRLHPGPRCDDRRPPGWWPGFGSGRHAVSSRVPDVLHDPVAGEPIEKLRQGLPAVAHRVLLRA